MSAPDVRRTLTIAAPPSAVYQALTQRDGLRGWWSTGTVLDGDHIRFVWSDTDHTTFRVDRLDEPSRVEWTCVAQHDGNLPQPDEWVGTAVSFALNDVGEGTRLDFLHAGLADLECGDVCSGGPPR